MESGRLGIKSTESPKALRAGVDNTLSTGPHSSIMAAFTLERAFSLDSNRICMFLAKTLSLRHDRLNT